eukprot:UN2454
MRARLAPIHLAPSASLLRRPFLVLLSLGLAGCNTAWTDLRLLGRFGCRPITLDEGGQLIQPRKILRPRCTLFE